MIRALFIELSPLLEIVYIQPAQGSSHMTFQYFISRLDTPQILSYSWSGTRIPRVVRRRGGYGQLCGERLVLEVAQDSREAGPWKSTRWMSTSHADVEPYTWGEARREASRRRVAAGGAARSSGGGPLDRPPPENLGTEEGFG
jgi:hypothetical protein